MNDNKSYTVNENGNTELDIAIMEIDTYNFADQEYMDSINKQIMKIIDQSIESVMHKDNNGEYPLHKICCYKHFDNVVFPFN
jgi:hypothetical protein